MNIVEKYRELGSYRAAGRACGVDHKTVKVVVDRVERGEVDAPCKPVVREHNYDAIADLVRRRVEQTQGRISAKRLLPVAKAEGYAGSDRNFRRLVAGAKAGYRRCGRIFRPWRPAPGEFLAIDYGSWDAGRSSARCWCGHGSGSCASAVISSSRPRWRFSPSASKRSAGCQRWCWPIGSRVCVARSLLTGWSRTPTTCASPPITASGRTGASRPTRSRRGRGEPGRLRQDRSGHSLL